MKIQQYNAANMALLQDSITGFNFGTVYQGNHCEAVQVIRPVSTTESSITEMKLFLTSKGPYTASQFGYYGSAIATPGILPGSAIMSDHFDAVANAALSDAGGLSMTDGSYAWLDIQTSPIEIGTYPGITYKVVFDYV